VIYSQINKVISTERLEMFSLIAGSTVAILILVIFLIRWSNTLHNEVKKRMRELDEANKSITESNKRLALANEQLKIHDRMQRDFINIAAHELRTPIQPILSLTRIIQDRMSLKKEEGGRVVGNAEEQAQMELCQLQDVVIGSAKRLQRLTDDNIRCQ
jgi:signal transduction histidine kinase